MLAPKAGYLATVNLNGSTLTLPVARVEKDADGRWERIYFVGATYPYHRHEVLSVCRPSR